MELEKLYSLETTEELLVRANQIDDLDDTGFRRMVADLCKMLTHYRQFFLDVTNEDFLVELKNLCHRYPKEPVLNLFESRLSALKVQKEVPANPQAKESELAADLINEGYVTHFNKIDAEVTASGKCDKCDHPMRYIGLKKEDKEEFSGQSQVSYIAISHCDNCGNEYDF